MDGQKEIAPPKSRGNRTVGRRISYCKKESFSQGKRQLVLLFRRRLRPPLAAPPLGGSVFAKCQTIDRRPYVVKDGVALGTIATRCRVLTSFLLRRLRYPLGLFGCPVGTACPSMDPPEEIS